MFKASREDGICFLIATSQMIACSQLPTPTAVTQQPRSVPVVAASPPQARTQFTNKAWETQAETRQPAVSGIPKSMELGQRCVTFRTLPILEFHRNTLILDACLEIPSNTTIVVQSGVTLGIVAVNGLRVGRNVKFRATGLQGARGNRADFGTVTYTPDTDAQINAACVDDGNRCACPVDTSNASAILGHAGGNGSAGGSVRLVVGNLVAPAQLAGLKFDVSGGRGGPPGESGRQNCMRGNTQCISQSCSAGASNGTQGVSGSVFVALAGSQREKLLQLFGAACSPSDAATFVPIASNEVLQTEVSALNDTAYRNDWDRRSGQDPI